MDRLNEKYGSLSRFAVACFEWRATYGKIHCLSEIMMHPPEIDRIIENILLPTGMEHKKDFAFAYEFMAG